jgi:hypothetical protein
MKTYGAAARSAGAGACNGIDITFVCRIGFAADRFIDNS